MSPAENENVDLPIIDASANASAGGCGCGGCGCGDGVEAEAAGDAAAGPVSTEVLVAGMTCGHCVSAVTAELEALDGVTGVAVELNAGGVSRVAVSSTRQLGAQEIEAAVDEAGYELAPA